MKLTNKEIKMHENFISNMTERDIVAFIKYTNKNHIYFNGILKSHLLEKCEKCKIIRKK